MTKRMLIDATQAEESRVVIVNDGRIEEFDFVTSTKKQIKSNIYLAKITRVEPSLQAAFVEYGGGKQGFLPFAEIHPDYYQIPISDRKRLLEEQEAIAREEEAREAAEFGDAPILLSDNSSETPEFHSELPSQTHEQQQDAIHFMQDMPISSETFIESPIPQGYDQEPQLDAGYDAPAQDVFVGGADSNPTETTHYAAERTHFDDPQVISDSDAFTTAESYRDNEDRVVNVASGEDTRSDYVQDSELSAPLPENIEESQTSSEVETLGNEDETARPVRRQSYRRYKIQEVIKRGQIVLVQVIKEERGNKGVSLTTYMSLPGRYCVLMPNSPKDGGISRKISNSEDRRRLKQISAELRDALGMSVIIRTAGIDRTRAEIKRDYEYLVKLWNTIREQVLSSTAPALVYEEGDLIKRSIRDMYNSDIEEIYVEGNDAFAQAKEFMKMLMPSHAPRVKHYADPTPLYYAFDIEDQLVSMFDPVVKLRSGGYIVINPTEALISIDVNSGRSTTERNIEETAYKTNQEAAFEIARQIRLRDLAGLLVIDFIDMMDSRNRRGIEKALKDALRLDRAKIQLGRISPFGLLEMSRQRLRPSIAETSSMPCPTCSGKGIIRAHASVAIQALRAIKKEASTGNFGELRLYTTSGTAMCLLNQKREAVSAIENELFVRVTVLIDESLHAAGFRIEKQKIHPADRKRRIDEKKFDSAAPTHVSMSSQDMESIDEAVLTEETLMDDNNAEFIESASTSEERFGRNKRGYGNKRGGRGGRNQKSRFDNRTNQGENAPQEQSSEGGFNNDNHQQADFAPRTQEGEDGFSQNPDAPGIGESQDRPRRGGKYRDRGTRGGKGRNNRYKGDRPNREFQNNGASAESTPLTGSYAPDDFPKGGSFAPSSNTVYSAAPTSRPSRNDTVVQMSAQSTGGENYSPSSSGNASSDSGEPKPTKKGWWRRIVES